MAVGFSLQVCLLHEEICPPSAPRSRPTPLLIKQPALPAVADRTRPLPPALLTASGGPGPLRWIEAVCCSTDLCCRD
ncbi:hypothetical protein BRADI_3g41732v3 [Brachypodium distachyon]|uniref:Uncharacterized protein n=1 Tax=Brachypodium distachyon TaxID=15368 RepID=A0A2K2D2K6_BRADI|nr:hypothetical protein BRADI_3g41732v3 [Brachypodium distachyon]